MLRIQSRELLIAVVMAFRTVTVGARLSVVIVALSAACSPAPSVPDVELQPRHWQSEKLSVTFTDPAVSVWLCDFEVRKHKDLTIRVHAIQQGKSECLGEVSAWLAEQSKGFVYLTSVIGKGPEDIPYEIGVAGDAGRTRLTSLLKPVNVPVNQKLTNTLNQHDPIGLADGEEKVLRVILYRAEQPTGSGAIQEVLSSPSPFPSFTLPDVRRDAGLLKDATTIVLTVQVECRQP